MRKLIVDGHCDYILKRYYREVCHREIQPLQITRDFLQVAGVGLQVFAIFVPAPMERFGLECAIDMIGLLYEEIQNDSDVLLVRGPSEIEELRRSNKIGILMALEGAEPLGNQVRRLEVFYQLGVRLITLTWSRRNAFADGSSWDPSREKNYGLSWLGRDLVSAMNRRGVVVDVSHLNEKGFYEVMDLCSLPPIASHSCAKALRESPRNLTDEQIHLLAKKGGVVGINFYTGFLTDQKESTLEDVINHIDYICTLTGSCDFVGLGSDYDGIDSAPKGLENCSKIGSIDKALEKRGYSQDDRDKIMGENLVRVFLENWCKGDKQ